MSGRSSDSLVARVASAALEAGVTVVSAESVTAGRIGSSLASGDRASEWFSGSIVAYQTATKRRVLGVTTLSVITPECAKQMAVGARELTKSVIAVATTGVGGPDPDEGHPAGTVFICVASSMATRTVEHHFDGEPAEVVDKAARAGLRALLQELEMMRPRDVDVPAGSWSMVDFF